VTTPPVPDRLAEIVADAAVRLEAAGEPITPEAVAAFIKRERSRALASQSWVIVEWACDFATADYLRRRDADA
jgi:hypothetical protein